MGGNAVYAAAALRLWLGAGQVGIVGHVPANYPTHLLDRLRDAGILTGGIGRSQVRVRGPEWFFYAQDGSRRDEVSSPDDGDADPDFPIFRRSHPILPAHVPDEWLAAKGMHLAGNDPAATLDLAVAMRGARVTLDPGARAADLATHPDMARVLAAVTAVIPSLKELRILMPGQPREAALMALHHAGAHLALVKLGGDGILLRQPDGHLTPIPALTVTALDPTGAGDSFCGGFLAGLLLTDDPLMAACMGTVAASFAVEGFGPDTLLTAPSDQRNDRLADLVAQIGHPPFIPTTKSFP
ncbi:carbohydrate kinase family protein [Paracoccus sp. PAMC 22219]|uniref:carbohydrate kinase family protein n=1 Tax=Paracoccus sp. PAMC 22219 TaxID=1569209 RepID=UPI0005AA3747|nr:carbohydrate kinase family protein [Paracoccus sp. PAMC 22219]